MINSTMATHSNAFIAINQAIFAKIYSYTTLRLFNFALDLLTSGENATRNRVKVSTGGLGKAISLRC